MLNALDMRVVSVNPSFVDINLVSTNPEIREVSERQLIANIELAADLGASCVVVIPGRLHALAPAPPAAAQAVLDRGIARLVARAEELGITDESMARPVQAMAVSLVSFAIGGALPLGAMAAAPASVRAWVTVVVALIALVLLGAIGARLGGAPRGRAALRVVIGGAAAMALTTIVGKLFGAAIS